MLATRAPSVRNHEERFGEDKLTLATQGKPQESLVPGATHTRHLRLDRNPARECLETMTDRKFSSSCSSTSKVCQTSPPGRSYVVDPANPAVKNLNKQGAEVVTKYVMSKEDCEKPSFQKQVGESTTGSNVSGEGDKKAAPSLRNKYSEANIALLRTLLKQDSRWQLSTSRGKSSNLKPVTNARDTDSEGRDVSSSLEGSEADQDSPSKAECLPARGIVANRNSTWLDGILCHKDQVKGLISDAIEPEDLYCDDDLSGDNPNMRLHSAKAVEEELKDQDGHPVCYPPHPMLLDQGMSA